MAEKTYNCPMVSTCRWRSPINSNHPPDYCCVYRLTTGKSPGRVGDFCPAYERFSKKRKPNNTIYFRRDKCGG